MDACHICGEPFQIDENGIANRVVVPYDDAIYFQRVVGQLVQGKVS